MDITKDEFEKLLSRIGDAKKKTKSLKEDIEKMDSKVDGLSRDLTRIRMLELSTSLRTRC